MYLRFTSSLLLKIIDKIFLFNIAICDDQKRRSRMRNCTCFDYVYVMKDLLPIQTFETNA